MQLWVPQLREGIDLLGQVQIRARKMIRCLEHLSYEETLRELGPLSLEMRRYWEDLIANFHYLQEIRKTCIVFIAVPILTG